MTEQIEKISKPWATFLTILLSALLTAVIGLSGWSLLQIVELNKTLPEKYVCKADYERDRTTRSEREEKSRDEIVSWLMALNAKMDQSLSVQHDLDKRTAILEKMRGGEAR